MNKTKVWKEGSIVEVDTFRYHEKIFAVECKCNEPKVERGTPTYKFLEGMTCAVCNSVPWIILPREAA